MSADDTETNDQHTLLNHNADKTIAERNPSKSSKYQVSSSLSLVYVCLVLLLVTELLFSFGLYLYVAHIDDKYSTLLSQHSFTSTYQDHEGISRKKRSAVVEDNTVNPAAAGGVDANVEFFNPKLRQELEDKDISKKKAGGATGEGETANNPWVWLTSYSRIPLVAIQGFCSATRDYCPPGPPGSPGLPGSSGQRGGDGNKGDRGDRGFPGEEGKRGNPGIHGEQGPRGPEGESGSPGTPGLDGRDGVPGEPGLDGIPGRNGLDGIPGMDGMPGLNGIPGTPGTNGTDGRPGLTGPQGPQGPKGIRGLSGPRGNPGRAGVNGEHGKPGIQAWASSSNATSETLLIKPSIAGASSLVPQLIIVQESANVRMRCAATGKPHPHVEWRKMDGSPIPLGAWQAASVAGHTLNITKINREHMGSYLCIADNGVPPQANQTFKLEVHFAPMIRIHNQKVAVENGSTAVLECEVEAYPEAVRYWERADGRLLERSDKYRMYHEKQKQGKYKSKMQLNITRVGGADFGLYHCVCKNELGTTAGSFTLSEKDDRFPPAVVGSISPTFGTPKPAFTELDDLCPPPNCPECADTKVFKCQDGGISLFNLVKGMEIQAYGNETYPGLPNRTTDCQLYAVGKPVYHRFTDAPYGSWMKDSLPKTDAASEKFWVTKEEDSTTLFEFANKTVYRQDVPTKSYTLTHAFKGNAHVVYNGSFYYNEKDRARIVRYDLADQRTLALDVPDVSTNGTNYLYTTEHNYMDFSVDDNGLWVIYGLATINNTIVMKVDAFTMQKQFMWNISVNHHKVGEMFVVCGVLYAVDSCTERNTNIRFALDLYKNQLLDVNLAFTNPFRRTTMVGYNHRNKELYTWDKGNQLTYPIRYHEIGYNTTKEDKGEPEANAQVQTGYDVYTNNN